jgi:hypothetical protein
MSLNPDTVVETWLALAAHKPSMTSASGRISRARANARSMVCLVY